MKKFRIGLIIVSILIIIGQLTLVNYSDLSWSENAGSYLGIISMIFLILGMILSNKHETKSQEK
jgi:glucose uptake protein GlcU